MWAEPSSRTTAPVLLWLAPPALQCRPPLSMGGWSKATRTLWNSNAPASWRLLRSNAGCLLTSQPTLRLPAAPWNLLPVQDCLCRSTTRTDTTFVVATDNAGVLRLAPYFKYQLLAHTPRSYQAPGRALAADRTRLPHTVCTLACIRLRGAGLLLTLRLCSYSTRYMCMFIQYTYIAVPLCCFVFLHLHRLV